MTIGFVNLFSWRPHMEQMLHLARQCKKEGREVRFLTCNASLPSCYALEIRKSHKPVGCAKCILGSVRSYETQNITAIDKNMVADLPDDLLDELSFSSAATINRIEDLKDVARDPFIAVKERLKPSLKVIYENVHQWIKAEQLSGIVLFNGRMDVTAAVLKAAKDQNVPVITHERAWFGDGMHLVANDNCLGLKNLHQMVSAFDDKPLTEDQACLASQFIVRRLSGQQTHEWRQYNVKGIKTDWHLEKSVSKDIKILIVPSSRNESYGHPDWDAAWTDNRIPLTALIEHLGLEPSNYILRAHPNWGETIGKSDGVNIDQFYRDWCLDHQIRYVSPNENFSTHSLIAQADIVITNGSTAALEAGFLGKRVINLGAASYSSASFAEIVMTEKDIAKLTLNHLRDPKYIIRQTLRYLYTHGHRYTQFSDGVQMVDSANCRFFDQPVLKIIEQIFSDGFIRPYDASYADDSQQEDNVIAHILNGRWHDLSENATEEMSVDEILIQRRSIFRLISVLRPYIKVGDR